MTVVCAYCKRTLDSAKAVWIGNAAIPDAAPTWCLCQKCADHADEHGDGG